MFNNQTQSLSHSRIRWFATGSLIFGALVLGLVALPVGADSGPFRYPKARKVEVVDEYHGVKVADPYRWLEDPASRESREWIEAQNRLTYGFLESIPERDAIRERLTQLWNYERFGLPSKRENRYFYSRNDGLQNQNVLYTATSLTAEPKVLLDPNKLSEDGTVALSGTAITENGKLMAYGLSARGSDWQEWKVRNISTGEDLEDQIQWVKFSSASWMKDGGGFFYSRYDEPKEGTKHEDVNYYHKLYYHKLGTPQSEDKLVYHRPDQKEWGFGGEVSEDGKYFIINVWRGTERKNLINFVELGDKAWSVTELIKEFQAQYNFIHNDGYLFYFYTDFQAPRGRVVAIDVREPHQSKWKEIIPQSEATLRGANFVGGRLIASYLKDARSEIKVFEPDGTFVRDVDLPGLGSAGGFGGRADDPETFYTYTSFTDPGTIFRYDVRSGESQVWRRPKVKFNPSDYETKQVFYRSKDGTRIPMFITYKKPLKLTGDNSTLLYGYGGFNIAITPGFSVKNLGWLDMGGVYAVANIRGGGEYGKEWHEAGMKLNKQNCFDDFIAAGEWLIENKYTRTDKLAIHGGSNGGLLVGAVVNQRPDLFGAALPAVGVMDMLRFSKFTIGWAWVSDYGTPDNEDEFKALYAYSPYHNLKPGTSYPAIMITTADTDDRVVPAHSFKYAARLQEMQSGPAPTLIRIQTKAGHGAGKPTSMQIEEVADMWAFLVKVLNMKADLPGAKPQRAQLQPAG
jgi:prolyl oligopeptidase